MGFSSQPSWFRRGRNKFNQGESYHINYKTSHDATQRNTTQVVFFTLSSVCPCSLWYWKFPPSLLYSSLYLVTHWSRSLLPWVATRVTLVFWPMRSIWSHWLTLLWRADQAPAFSPGRFALRFSLPWIAAWLGFHCEDALICPSEIVPFSMPRAFWHAKCFKNLIKETDTALHFFKKYVMKILTLCLRVAASPQVKSQL